MWGEGQTNSILNSDRTARKRRERGQEESHPRAEWTQMALTAPLNSEPVTLIAHRQAAVLVPDAGETC